MESKTNSDLSCCPPAAGARTIDLCNANSVKRWTVASVGEALGLTERTLEHLKEHFVKYGLDAALERKVNPSRKLIFDGEFAARLTQLACSKAPAGRSRWTVRLLAEKLVELQMVPTVWT